MLIQSFSKIIIRIETNNIFIDSNYYLHQAVLYAATLIDATGYRYKPDPNSVKPMLLDKLVQTGLMNTKHYGSIH